MRSVTRVTVSTYSIILAIAGIEHGIGEIFQGNNPPSSIMIQSWPDSDLYEILNGEPAMTIIPNLFITGILTVIASLLLIIWAIKFIQTKHGGTGIIFLSFLLLLVGGGLAGPLLIGITVSLASTRINSEFKWWREHVSVKNRTILANTWIYSYIVSILFWFSLWPGLVILGMFTKLEDPIIVIMLSLFSFVMMILTIFSAFASDSLKALITTSN